MRSAAGPDIQTSADLLDAVHLHHLDRLLWQQTIAIADLDARAVVHFSIMSDHKGDSPHSSVEFARMVAWVRAGHSAFVVGLGDHVKVNWENSFIPRIVRIKPADGNRERRWSYQKCDYRHQQQSKSGIYAPVRVIDAAVRLIDTPVYQPHILANLLKILT